MKKWRICVCVCGGLKVLLLYNFPQAAGHYKKALAQRLCLRSDDIRVYNQRSLSLVGLCVPPSAYAETKGFFPSAVLHLTSYRHIFASFSIVLETTYLLNSRKCHFLSDVTNNSMANFLSGFKWPKLCWKTKITDTVA